jgi:putative FmdB family regulatory protein
MPIYTYRCESCGVQFERQQSYNDEPLTRCPECNKKSLRKVYAPVGVVFKGSGWYATDHKSPSGASRPSKSENKGSSSASSSETSGTSSSGGSSSSKESGSSGGSSE